MGDGPHLSTRRWQHGSTSETGRTRSLQAHLDWEWHLAAIARGPCIRSGPMERLEFAVLSSRVGQPSYRTFLPPAALYDERFATEIQPRCSRVGGARRRLRRRHGHVVLEIVILQQRLTRARCRQSTVGDGADESRAAIVVSRVHQGAFPVHRSSSVFFAAERTSRADVVNLCQ